MDEVRVGTPRGETPAEMKFSDISSYSPEEQDALTYHRNNLLGGTHKRNHDGSLTTFYGAVVDTNEGSMIIPRYWHGQIRSVPEAMELAMKSQYRFPRYPNTNAALAAEKKMHDQMSKDVDVFGSHRGGN